MCGHNNITFFYETNITFKLQGYPFFFFSQYLRSGNCAVNFVDTV